MTDSTPKHASAETTKSTGPVLSAKWYERLKWFTIIFLPAFSALYFGLAQIWGLPAAQEVVGTLALVATALGTTLGISSRNFKSGGSDGTINARIDGDQVVLSRISLPNIAPEELATKKSITIQVNPSQ